MTTVTAKATRKSKQKPPVLPSTVLTITLNPDQTGTLIVKHGDLAALNQFTYQDMPDILAVIQQGMTQLAEVEKNPPPKDVSAPAQTNPVRLPESAAPNVSEPGATAVSTTEAESLLHSALPTGSADAVPLTPLPANSTVQLNLL